MKRYFLFVIICFLAIGVISVGAKKPIINKTIVVDPGHGGVDPGTIYKDIYEKDITLKISLFLKEALEKKGYKVILTRNDDYDLSSPNAFYRKKSDFDNRIRIINDYANYYLSIHLNYLADKRYSGIQVFSMKDNVKDANIMQKHLNKKLKSNRKNKLIPNNTYMYNKLSKKGLLIECGFLSNDEERNLLLREEYQKRMAKEIANGMSNIDI